MGRLVKRRGKICIQNTRNKLIGRCFKERKVAQKELSKLKKRGRQCSLGKKILERRKRSS